MCRDRVLNSVEQDPDECAVNALPGGNQDWATYELGGESSVPSHPSQCTLPLRAARTLDGLEWRIQCHGWIHCHSPRALLLRAARTLLADCGEGSNVAAGSIATVHVCYC